MDLDGLEAFALAQQAAEHEQLSRHLLELQAKERAGAVTTAQNAARIIQYAVRIRKERRALAAEARQYAVERRQYEAKRRQCQGLGADV